MLAPSAGVLLSSEICPPERQRELFELLEVLARESLAIAE